MKLLVTTLVVSLTSSKVTADRYLLVKLKRIGKREKIETEKRRPLEQYKG
jgi:hypothetical protein